MFLAGPVAFHVVLTTYGTIATGEHVTFDQVLINHGNG